MPDPKTSAIAAYVPALHRGYMELFARYPDIRTMYVFGQSILKKEDYLRKDLRALTPDQQAQVIQALGYFKEVKILEEADLPKISKKHDRIVMPDEDISRTVAELLPKGTYEFSPVFLRWDRRAVQANAPVNADRTISGDQFDREIMKQAAGASKKSTNIWRRVGAVIVRDGKVLAEASNRHMPTDHSLWIEGDPRGMLKQGEGIETTTDMHAEARLIASAARDGVPLEGASIYVTNFPCPPCAKLIAESGIKKCYYSGGYAVLDGEKVLKSCAVELIHVDEPEDAGHPAEWVPYQKG